MAVSPSSAMSFFERLLDPEAKAESIRNHPQGLSSLQDKEHADEALKLGLYGVVLKRIWAEKDPSKSLAFLREEQRSLFPFLSYERALLEFQVCPTEETIIEVSAPLLSLGELRNALDAGCFNNGSLYGSINRINAIYQELFSRLVKEKFPLGTAIANKEVERSLENLGKYLLKIYGKLSHEKVDFPSPLWLSGVEESYVSMKPVEVWNLTRLSLIREMIEEVTATLEKVSMVSSPLMEGFDQDVLDQIEGPFCRGEPLRKADF